MPDRLLLDDPVGRLALGILQPLLAVPILDHSLRTYHLADAECGVHGWDVAPLDLLIACLFHDSGTIRDNSPERFEVTGADRAVEFARAAGRDAASCRAIWDAIALHTSPGLAERRGALCELTRGGVGVDFGRGAEVVTEPQGRAIHAAYPRLAMERSLVDLIVRQARERPEKAPPYSIIAELVRERSTGEGLTLLERTLEFSPWAGYA
jgi:hypothetical protein